MCKKMKQFLIGVLLLVMSVSLLAVPASAETLTAKIDVQVKIDGYQPAQKDTYRIRVTPEDGSFPMPAGGSNGIYTIKGEGTLELVFSYQGLGVYNYTIRQEDCGNGGCYHDDGVYDLTVYVLNAKQPAEGKRFDVIAVLKLRGSDAADKPEKILFTNKYAKPAEVTLSARKTYNGKTPKTGRFDFRLRTGSGETVETVSNVGRNVTFTPLVFDKVGTYTYRISEVIGDEAYMIYDKSIYSVTVTVTRDTANEGDYEAAVTYKKGVKNCDKDDLVFANRSQTGGLPFTGDIFRMGLWIGIMAVSLAALAVLLVYWKKNRKR